ncbi:type II toxin-antitoxin system Phd/YefM family antitoxin [Trinickia mobilis]|uniref:type II toxin-antitoxin system Phd/YefM family antitoxin n=1 Tax=Trinickia mobilis TaxID=2816356 RepID=UPI001A8CE98F|nr:hypothetical protein [Trinickia mobilis]
MKKVVLVVIVSYARVWLSRLVEAIVRGREPEIVIARNSRQAAKLVPVDTVLPARRLGVAKGGFEVPDSIDKHNDEVGRLFQGRHNPGVQGRILSIRHPKGKLEMNKGHRNAFRDDRVPVGAFLHAASPPYSAAVQKSHRRRQSCRQDSCTCVTMASIRCGSTKSRNFRDILYAQPGRIRNLSSRVRSCARLAGFSRRTALAYRQRQGDLISVTELARLLFVSKRYVRKKLLRKHILCPVTLLRGRKYVIRAKAEAYYRKRRRIARRALREMARVQQEGGFYS